MPAYFGETVLIRDPGCNIGHWNARQRDVAGATLVRFSGYDVDQPERVSRYRDLRVDELGPFAEVWRDYHRRLVSAGTAGESYAYDRFDNGARIPAIAREMPLWGDPFGDEFFRWLAEGDPVPRMWEFVRERRPDLRRGFAGDDDGFLAWVATHGAEEYGSLG